MNQETNSVKSNIYTLNPDKKVTVKYIIIDPDNTWDGNEYVKYRDVITELQGTAIGDAAMEEYVNGIEGKFDQEDFDHWCMDYLEEIASDMGVRIFKVIK